VSLISGAALKRGPVRSEKERGRPADTAAGTGHDGAAPGEIERVVHRFSLT